MRNLRPFQLLSRPSPLMLRLGHRHSGPAPAIVPTARSSSGHASSEEPVTRRWALKSTGLGLFGIVFASLGFYLAGTPLGAVLSSESASHRSTAGAAATHGECKAVEAFIDAHPLAAELRSRPNFEESRPHLKLPASFRGHSLTAGTLLGPGRIAVAPFCWFESGGKSAVSIMYLGQDLCGHPGIVHGGVLATLLDEGLARCCFDALPRRIAVTAKLEIDYRKPTPAGSYVVLRATTQKIEGRKAWVTGHIETLPPPGEEPVILAEAAALFVSPKLSAMIPMLLAGK